MTDKEIKQLEELKKKQQDETRKARLKRQNDKIKEDYDRVSCVLPKGYKDIIKSTGDTVNGFILEAVKEKLQSKSLI